MNTVKTFLVKKIIQQNILKIKGRNVVKNRQKLSYLSCNNFLFHFKIHTKKLIIKSDYQNTEEKFHFQNNITHLNLKET